MFGDFHVHTTYSDGKYTPEEMIQAALNRGMDTLGFSDHSYTECDPSYCMTEKGTKEYVKEIRSLQKKYKNDIRIYLGVEQDYMSGLPKEDYDYVIGSCHYIYVGGEYFAIDHEESIQRDLIQRKFGGDPYPMVEEYFRLMGDMYQKTHADIIGHFDVISKFNQDGHLFDENNIRYVNAWKGAVDSILKTPAIFEINTGGIARGYKTDPYPSNVQRNYIEKNGGSFLLTSDSHHVNNIAYKFDEFSAYFSNLSIKDPLFLQKN